MPSTELRGGRADPARLRGFALQIGGAVAAVFGVILPLVRGGSLPAWPWAVFVALAAAGLLAPRILAPVYRAWMAFAAVLGAINSRILLTVVFLFVFTPVALLQRVMRRDPLRARRDPAATSYRIPSTAPAPNHMTRPF